MCPHCGAINGVVKKVGALKISHEKYRNRKKLAEDWADFKGTMEFAARESREIAPHLEKAEEHLNPLRVLTLFQRVPPSVRYSPFYVSIYLAQMTKTGCGTPWTGSCSRSTRRFHLAVHLGSSMLH
jgi:hypothetical protein